MFSVARPRPAQATRQQQIDSLRVSNPHVSAVPTDPSSWDIGLLLQQERVVVRVRTTLPPGFPETEAPVVRLLSERVLSHPWLDREQRVVGSPELSPWVPTKNLGLVVLSIIQHFGNAPPRIVAPPPQPQIPEPRHDTRPEAQDSKRPDTAARSRHHIALPPLPDSFPELDSLSLAELEALKASAEERSLWLKEHETLKIFQALLTSQQDRLVAAATHNLELQAEITKLKATSSSAEAALQTKRQELAAIRSEAQAVLARCSPARLARDLQATARELELMSERLADDFVNGDSGGGPQRRDNASVGSGDGGGVSVSGSTAGGSSSAATLREFREDFLAQRKRFHLARAKAALLAQKGFVPPTA